MVLQVHNPLASLANWIFELDTTPASNVYFIVPPNAPDAVGAITILPSPMSSTVPKRVNPAAVPAVVAGKEPSVAI
ncbi:Uncharacterised protein [Vibrio cholerae]|nr:Uncharacterised protein [Vibrio cholerae]